MLNGLLRILADLFVVAVTRHRFEPMSLTFKASKRVYGLEILRPLIRFDAFPVTATTKSADSL